MAITKIQPNAIPSGTDFNIQLTDGSVVTADIADSNVTTAKIADANVTHAKLHTDMDLSGKTVTLPDLTKTLNIHRIEANSIPRLQLKRTGNNAGNGYIECLGADDSIDYKIAFAEAAGLMTFEVAGVDAMNINGSGNVGINIDAPSEKLEIFGGDLLLSTGPGGNNTPNAALKFEYNGHQFAKIVGHGRDSSGYGDIDFYTSTSAGVTNLLQRMTIRADGKVGIGIDSPSQALHVKGSNSPIRIDNYGSGRSGIEIYNGSTKKADITWNEGNANLEIKNYRNDSQSGGPYANIDFFTGGSLATSPDYNPSLRMRIQQTGEVGIGTTDPTELLHLYSGSNTRLFIETSSTGAVPEIRFNNTAKTWRVGEETSTNAGGGAYNNSGASDFVINDWTDDKTWVFTTGGTFNSPSSIRFGTYADIGRVDQGNTGSTDNTPGLSRYSFQVISDGNWYDVLTNFREFTGHFWATVSDASSRSRAEYTFTMTSPAYGVSAFTEVAFYGGGWNTGDFEFRTVSDGSTSFRLQVKRTSYYSSSNISNGRITLMAY